MKVVKKLSDALGNSHYDRSKAAKKAMVREEERGRREKEERERERGREEESDR